MRSMISASCAAEHGVEPPLHPRDVVEFTRATLPPVALMFVGPVASAVGSGKPVAPPASCTRKYWPGLSITLGSTVMSPDAPRRPVPVALVYCTDFPPRETAAAPRL